MARRRKVTAKSLGLVPGTKLSEMYAHTKNDFKVVDDYVLGFEVYGSERNGYTVNEILRATIYRRIGKVQHIISTYEHGRRLVAYPDDPRFSEQSAIAIAVSRLLGVLQQGAK